MADLSDIKKIINEFDKIKSENEELKTEIVLIQNKTNNSIPPTQTVYIMAEDEISGQLSKVIHSEIWLKDGIRFRENNMPSFIEYNTKGKIKYEIFTNSNGKQIKSISYYKSGNKEVEHILHVSKKHFKDTKESQLKFMYEYDSEDNKRYKKTTYNEKTNKISEIRYIQDFFINRKDNNLPAIITFDENEKIISLKYYNGNGQDITDKIIVKQKAPMTYNYHTEQFE